MGVYREDIFEKKGDYPRLLLCFEDKSGYIFLWTGKNVMIQYIRAPDTYLFLFYKLNLENFQTSNHYL